MKKICKFICSLLVISMLLNFSPLFLGIDNGIIITASAASISKPNFTVNTGDSCVTISWQAINNADKYYIYCYLGDEKIALKSTKKTSIVIDNLKNETEYKFLVCTVKGDEKSKYTDYDWIYATPSKDPVTKLNSPDISVSQSSSKIYTVNLKWRKVANATSYAIYYKKGSDKKYKKAGTTANSFYSIDLGLLNSGKYNFYVKALYFDDDGKTISTSSKVKSINVKDVELSPEDFAEVMNAVLENDAIKESCGDVKIKCLSNTRNFLTYDVWIQVDSTFLMLELLNAETSINVTKKDKEQMILKNVALQYLIYHYAERFMPKKKITGGLYLGYYKYPNLKLDYESTTAFTWVNYSNAKNGIKYSDTKYTGKMQWNTYLDDYDLPLTQKLIDQVAKEFENE